ncbi:MAG: MBL fold metallo-hydrolase [Acidobacteria bacterium]|nr:MBL fold metallo-hydrolase [Acidobacteriota bacterium]
MLSDRGTAAFFFFLFFSLVLLSCPVFAFILLVAAVPALFVPKLRQNAALLLVVGGLIFTSFSIRSFQEHRLENLIGTPVTVSGILHDIHKEDRFISGTLLFATLKNYRDKRLALPGTIRFTVSGTSPLPGMIPGSIVSVTGKLRKHRVYRNTGTDRTWFYLSRHRLFSVSVPDHRMIKADPGLLSAILKKVNPFTSLNVSPLNRRILRGMIAGDRNALPDAFTDKVRDLGIYHLFVVSGFHFGILFSIAYLLLFLLPIRPRARKWLALALVTLMLPVTGFSPSGLRAWLMIFVFLLFRAREIDVTPSDAVGMAGLLLLVWNPFHVGDPGFLLSFLVAGAIVSVIDAGDKWWQVWLKIPIVAFLAASPVLFLFFHRLAPLSILVNLLVTPLVIVIFYLFFFTAFGLPFAPVLNRAVSLLTALTDRVSPHVLTVWAPLPLVMLLFAAAGTAILLRNKRRGFGILASVFAITLFVSIVWRPSPECLRIPDTGQSQAVLLQTHGKNYLFDAAGLWESRLALVPWLQAIGIRKIDAVFLSHFDSDHAGGLAGVADSFPVGQVYAPYLDGHSFTFNRDFSALARHNIPLRLLSAIRTPKLRFPGILIRVLHPESVIRGSAPTNACSLVLKVKTGITSVLFPGDLDGEALLKLIPRLSHADILLAPHHGSRHAAISGLEKAVSPRFVIVCCGRHNRFHFPSPGFLRLFRDIPVLTTAARGEITIKLTNSRGKDCGKKYGVEKE